MVVLFSLESELSGETGDLGLQLVDAALVEPFQISHLLLVVGAEQLLLGLLGAQTHPQQLHFSRRPQRV